MSEYIRKPLSLQYIDDEKIKEAHRYAQQCEWVDAMIAMSKRPMFHDIVGHNLGIDKEYFDDLTEHDDFQLLVSHFIAEMEKCGPQDTDIEDNVIASFETALEMLISRKGMFHTEHGRFVRKPEIIDRITEDQLHAAYLYEDKKNLFHRLEGYGRTSGVFEDFFEEFYNIMQDEADFYSPIYYEPNIGFIEYALKGAMEEISSRLQKNIDRNLIKMV